MTILEWVHTSAMKHSVPFGFTHDGIRKAATHRPRGPSKKSSSSSTCSRQQCIGVGNRHRTDSDALSCQLFVGLSAGEDRSDGVDPAVLAVDVGVAVPVAPGEAGKVGEVGEPASEIEVAEDGEAGEVGEGGVVGEVGEDGAAVGDEVAEAAGVAFSTPAAATAADGRDSMASAHFAASLVSSDANGAASAGYCGFARPRRRSLRSSASTDARTTFTTAASAGSTASRSAQRSSTSQRLCASTISGDVAPRHFHGSSPGTQHRRSVISSDCRSSNWSGDGDAVSSNSYHLQQSRRPAWQSVATDRPTGEHNRTTRRRDTTPLCKHKHAPPRRRTDGKPYLSDA
jgi:hypothetical protein